MRPDCSIDQAISFDSIKSRKVLPLWIAVAGLILMIRFLMSAIVTQFILKSS